MLPRSLAVPSVKSEISSQKSSVDGGKINQSNKVTDSGTNFIKPSMPLRRLKQSSSAGGIWSDIRQYGGEEKDIPILDNIKYDGYKETSFDIQKTED